MAIALSGGVDSLVAGYLLKNSGFDLFGIHFLTGYEKEKKDLSSISRQLDIPVKQVDLSKVFEKRVVSYFVNTYLSGKTPNPCVMCNREIKFSALWQQACSEGADLIATGHYARSAHDSRGSCIRLLKGLDQDKEQSYFLSMLSQKQLETTLFPLGEYTKTRVRETAALANLVPEEKKESQDICFINHGNTGGFISAKTGIVSRKGEIVKSDGTVLGEHNGLFKFTVGQRRGINCPGPEPYYVKAIDTEKNSLMVGRKEELLKKSFFVDSINLISENIRFPVNAVTKIRYNHPGAESLLSLEGDLLKVELKEPQHAVTPGQTAVFYQNDEVLGGGTIL